MKFSAPREMRPFYAAAFPKKSHVPSWNLKGYLTAFITMYQFLLCSKVNQLYLYMYPLFFKVSFPFSSPQSTGSHLLMHTSQDFSKDLLDLIRERYNQVFKRLGFETRLISDLNSKWSKDTRVDEFRPLQFGKATISEVILLFTPFYSGNLIWFLMN